MTAQQAAAKVKSLFGEDGFAASVAVQGYVVKAVGKSLTLHCPNSLERFKATTMKAGWGDTWEEAFENYQKKHEKA